MDPDIILMDEPFSAVDEQTRRKFQEDMLSLVKNEQKTFIFVTHSIEEAVYVSDRIVLKLIADEESLVALREHQELISTETLAKELSVEAGSGDLAIGESGQMQIVLAKA